MDNGTHTNKIDVEAWIKLQAQELAEKLNEEIERGNDTGAFMIAILLAAFKDFMDVVLTFLLIGLIPGVNFLVGLFLSTFLFFFLLGKGWLLKFRVRLWYLVLCIFIDGLPVFSALPTNTLYVLYAWRLVKKKKVAAEEALSKINQLTEVEINALLVGV